MSDTQREDELRPVPKERAVLESFFTQLGMFWFDRAKDYVEKEKDASKSAGAIWASLLLALAHLAAAEKAYHNMTFLGQKLGAREAFPTLHSFRKYCGATLELFESPFPLHKKKKSLVNQNYDIKSQSYKYGLQMSMR